MPGNIVSEDLWAPNCTTDYEEQFYERIGHESKYELCTSKFQS